MINKLRKTTGMFFVSATLGLAGVSATAEANPRPTSDCESMVRAWCDANWSYWYWPPSGYEQCVAAELPMRCRQNLEGEWEYPEV
jgi:hypothetical protein